MHQDINTGEYVLKSGDNRVNPDLSAERVAVTTLLNKRYLELQRESNGDIVTSYSVLVPGIFTTNALHFKVLNSDDGSRKVSVRVQAAGIFPRLRRDTRRLFRLLGYE